MNEQFTLFDIPQDPTPIKTPADLFDRVLFPLLTPVLETNGYQTSDLSFRTSQSAAGGLDSVYFRTVLFCNIKFSGKIHYLRLTASHSDLLPPDIHTESKKSDAGATRIYFDDPSDLNRCADFLQAELRTVLGQFPSTFDCCSRYKECSAAMRCVNPDPDLAVECSYRKVLLSGKVFF